VNAGALRAGLAALEPEAEVHIQQARALVARSRRLLTEGLTHLGFEVEPSVANFVLVRVGDGADIGVNAVLMPGVTIGPGAIVGAGAVVTQDVAPSAIVAGVPAKFLRSRSDTPA
jgi:acetyltransferase-like isoleucine patch superfamily enzyme